MTCKYILLPERELVMRYDLHRQRSLHFYLRPRVTVGSARLFDVTVMHPCLNCLVIHCAFTLPRMRLRLVAAGHPLVQFAPPCEAWTARGAGLIEPRSCCKHTWFQVLHDCLVFSPAAAADDSCTHARTRLFGALLVCFNDLTVFPWLSFYFLVCSFFINLSCCKP